MLLREIWAIELRPRDRSIERAVRLSQHRCNRASTRARPRLIVKEGVTCCKARFADRTQLKDLYRLSATMRESAGRRYKLCYHHQTRRFRFCPAAPLALTLAIDPTSLELAATLTLELVMVLALTLALALALTPDADDDPVSHELPAPLSP